MATKKINVMADVKTVDPVGSYVKPTKEKKPNPRQKRTEEETFRTNIVTTKALWADFKDLAHLKQITPNELMEELIKREIKANETLLKKFRDLAAQVKEG